MGDCWATGAWAASAWASGSWVDTVLVQLGLGDLTVVFAAWLDTLAGDKNTRVRDVLASAYGAAQPADTTSLVSRFLGDR